MLLAALTLAARFSVGQEAPPYGPPITLDQAKKAVAAAESEALKNQWNVVIAISDFTVFHGGHSECRTVCRVHD